MDQRRLGDRALRLRLELRNGRPRIVENGLQSFENGLIGTKEIEEGYRQDQQQPCQEAYEKKDDLHVCDELLVMGKLVGSEHVEQEKRNRDHAIVDTVFQKRKLRGGEKS